MINIGFLPGKFPGAIDSEAPALHISRADT
jgi:hypothetical protein